MPRALVTGATGFVGSHLVDLLLGRGYRVACAVRNARHLRWLAGKSVDLLEVDFAKPLRLPEVDVVFHVAGLVMGRTYDEYLAGNRRPSQRMIEAARCGRFVHVSSIAATGPGVVDENSECRPISLYGRSKLEGELEVWKHRERIPVTVVSPPAVYGERDAGLLDLYRTVAMGLRPRIGRTKWVSLIHVRDLVEGIVAAAEHSAGADNVFFLADERPYRMTDLMDSMAMALGRRFSLSLPIPDRVVMFLAGVAEDVGRAVGKKSMFNRDKTRELIQSAWVCSPSKAARLLGWRARTGVEEGLKSTLAWYRQEGIL